MRTTLAIDDDVLIELQDIATREGRDVGKVLSDLTRQAFAKMDQEQERQGLEIE